MKKQPVAIPVVAISVMDLMQQMQKLQKNPPPPPTAEQQAEIDEMVAELSKYPGFMQIKI